MMLRTYPLFQQIKKSYKTIVINNKTYNVTKTLHLKPGKFRYPFHIGFGGIDEGPYKKDSIIYTKDMSIIPKL